MLFFFQASYCYNNKIIRYSVSIDGIFSKTKIFSRICFPLTEMINLTEASVDFSFLYQIV